MQERRISERERETTEVLKRRNLSSSSALSGAFPPFVILMMSPTRKSRLNRPTYFTLFFADGIERITTAARMNADHTGKSQCFDLGGTQLVHWTHSSVINQHEFFRHVSQRRIPASRVSLSVMPSLLFNHQESIHLLLTDSMNELLNLLTWLVECKLRN